MSPLPDIRALSNAHILTLRLAQLHNTTIARTSLPLPSPFTAPVNLDISPLPSGKCVHLFIAVGSMVVLVVLVPVAVNLFSSSRNLCTNTTDELPLASAAVPSSSQSSRPGLRKCDGDEVSDKPVCSSQSTSYCKTQKDLAFQTKTNSTIPYVLCRARGFGEVSRRRSQAKYDSPILTDERSLRRRSGER